MFLLFSILIIKVIEHRIIAFDFRLTHFNRKLQLTGYTSIIALIYWVFMLLSIIIIKVL